MKLDAIPFACSLAVHIALREARLAHEVRWFARASPHLRDRNPKGRVATLECDDGTILTENLAILLYIADRAPEAKLAPPSGTPERQRLYEWLSFIATELHKQVLWAWFDPAVPEAMEAHVATALLPDLLRHPAEALAQQPFLLGEDFSVADAYLFWSLLLIPRLGVKLDAYPSLVAFRDAVMPRSSVREVLTLERRALAVPP